MNIRRAIAIQSLAVCAGLLLVVLVTIHSWGRHEQAQTEVGLNSKAVQDFRLLEYATKSWLLNNDLIFASNQKFLINSTRRQGRLLTEAAESLARTELGRAADVALTKMTDLVAANEVELERLQYVSSSVASPDTPDPLDAWDQRSFEMAENLDLAHDQIGAAVNQKASMLEGERNYLIRLTGITYLTFAALVFALWRWLSRSLAKPLSDLTELAEEALTSRKSLDLEAAGPTEVRKLTSSINAFIRGREAQAFRRAGELEEQKRLLEIEVSKRKAAESDARESEEEARAASKAKSQFLANMSHEIRTPLNGIIGSAEILMREKSPEKTEWGLGNIQKSSRHLLSLVNDILDFSKIEAGELGLSPNEFLLEELLTELRSIFAARARGSDLMFVYDIAPDVPLKIEADSLRIRQVLTNLLGNAFTYTDHGFIVLRCSYEPGDAGSSDALVWTVQDTGIGIPPEKQANIFESFRQADSATTRVYGGTGLGLSISKQLVELMGGWIEVESELGAGSTFRCLTQISVPDDQPELGTLPEGHAMVAIDNPGARRTLSIMLDDWGWSYECMSMIEGLARLSDTPEAYADSLVIMNEDVLADTSLLIHSRNMGLNRLVFADPENVDDDILKASANEVVMSYTVVPSELFRKILAMVSPEAAEATEEVETTKLEGHVLLAEDNIVNQQVTRAMLEFLGLKVSIAGDGEIAVDMHNSEAPDLILMDWHMPNLDGVEATRKIRDLERSEGKCQTPIVMFTADTQKDSLAVCMDAGVNDFLPKPVEMEALRTALAAQL